MTDLDLERLGDVWRQQPDPAEMERLVRTANAVARRARLSKLFDMAAEIGIGLVVILLVLANPKFDTFLMGAAALIVLLASNARQRRKHRVELKNLTGTTEDMLDQSIERVGTTVRHSRLSLIAMIPAFLVASLFAVTTLDDGVTILGTLTGMPTLRLFWVGGWIAFVLGLAIVLAITVRRGRQELDGLVRMRQSYRDESESTDP